jgi:hypothetical protein
LNDQYLKVRHLLLVAMLMVLPLWARADVTGKFRYQQPTGWTSTADGWQSPDQAHALEVETVIIEADRLDSENRRVLREPWPPSDGLIAL